MAYKEITSLSELGFGVVNEQYYKQLKAVLENMQNPATDPVAARQIKLTLVIKPTEDRESAAISVRATSVLAPVKEDKLTVRLDRNNKGEIVLTQKEPENQLELFKTKEA